MICRFKGSKIPDKLFAQGSYDCAGSGLMPPLKTTKLNSGYGSPAFKEGLPKAIIKFLDL
jgi:peptide methionine sulfoxide reductase MsrB